MPKIPTSNFTSSVDGPLPQFGLSKDKKVSTLLQKLETLIESFVSKAAILIQLTHDGEKKEELRASTDEANTILLNLPQSVQDLYACSQIRSALESFSKLLQLKC